MKTPFFLFLFAVIASCENDHNSTTVCPTPENLEHFPWVVEMIDNLGSCDACITSVVRGTYRAKTVVFILMNDPLCNGIFTGPLYDCRGRVVRNISSSENDQQEFHKWVSASIVLGQCAN